MEEILDSPKSVEESYFSHWLLKWLLISSVVVGFLYQAYLMFYEYQIFENLRASTTGRYIGWGWIPTYYNDSYLVRWMGYAGLTFALLILQDNVWKFPKRISDNLIFWSPVFLLILDKLLMEISLQLSLL